MLGIENSVVYVFSFSKDSIDPYHELSIDREPFWEPCHMMFHPNLPLNYPTQYIFRPFSNSLCSLSIALSLPL